jgi:hypothetical protein
MGGEGFVQYLKSEAGDYQRRFIEAADVLKSKPQNEWTQKEIEAYLFDVVHAMNFATMAFVMDNRRHPRDCDELKETGCLSQWPDNPLNDWQPVSWSEPGAALIPGNLVKQLCPPSEYSFPKNPTAITYVLTINGPEEDYCPIEPIYYTPPAWAHIPPGTAFAAAFGIESIAKTLKKQEAKKKRQEEYDKQHKQEQERE